MLMLVLFVVIVSSHGFSRCCYIDIIIISIHIYVFFFLISLPSEGNITILLILLLNFLMQYPCMHVPVKSIPVNRILLSFCLYFHSFSPFTNCFFPKLDDQVLNISPAGWPKAGKLP